MIIIDQKIFSPGPSLERLGSAWVLEKGSTDHAKDSAPNSARMPLCPKSQTINYSEVKHESG
jgi:hypothetical protein